MRLLEAWLFSCSTMLLALPATVAAGAPAGPPLLERYAFALGDSPGIDLAFSDPSLGGGGAFFRLDWRSRSAGAADLRFEIGRHVAPDTITFALLVTGIQIVVLDGDSRRVRKVNLQGDDLWPGGYFIIGDSADGFFQFRDTLTGVGRARRVVVKVFGNYE